MAPVTHAEAVAQSVGFVFGAGERPVVLGKDAAFVLLSQDKISVIDICDAEAAADHTWSAARPQKTFYAVTGPSSKRVFRLHRLLLGNPPLAIDHIDCDGLNNRRSNLREATPAQNARNHSRRPNNTSGFKGVSWRHDRGKWQAHIRVGHKRLSLGHHETAELAAAAYARASAEFHGEFGRTS